MNESCSLVTCVYGFPEIVRDVSLKKTQKIVVLCFKSNNKEKYCTIQFTKVNKISINAVKIMCLVASYKPQITCLQQHSI